MHRRKLAPRPALAYGAALALGVASASGHAATQFYQGLFADDDELFVTHFVLTQDDWLGVSTLSYAGGVSSAGQAVAAGGFAPVLSLFLDGAGLVQLAHGSSVACGPGSGGADPVSGFCWDARISSVLPAGHYTLVLSQDGNEPLGPEAVDGFSQAGLPDYTGQMFLGQTGRRFIQVDGAQRSGHWALEWQAASVPEVNPALLLLLGIAVLSARRTTRTHPN